MASTSKTGWICINCATCTSISYLDIGLWDFGESSRGNTIKGNRTESLWEEICLWEGLWENLWKPLKNLWKPLKRLWKPQKTSENLSKPLRTSKKPLKISENPPSQRPSQRQISSQRLSVLLPLFCCPLNSLRRFMVSQGVGTLGSWQLSHRFSGFLSWECPSVVGRSSTTCDLRHAGDDLHNKTANTSIMGLFWPNTTPNPTCSSKCTSMIISMILPCSGFGFDLRFQRTWNHGFDWALSSNRIKTMVSISRFLFALEICGFNLKIETVVLTKSKHGEKYSSVKSCPQQDESEGTSTNFPKHWDYACE